MAVVSAVRVGSQDESNHSTYSFMESSDLINDLILRTWNLQPAKGTPEKQLTELRERLARYLLESPTRLATQEPDLFTIPVGDLSGTDVHEKVSELVNRIWETVPMPPTTEQTSTRMFVREVPVISSQLQQSVPKWAAGQKPAYSYGPFLNEKGVLQWFDFYHIVSLATVIVEGQAGPLLKLSLRIPLLATASDAYTIVPNTIWIASRYLSNQAPAGGYTGLRIKGGKLKLNERTPIVNNILTLKNTSSFTLELNLDPQQATLATDTTTGVDAMNLQVDLPTSVVLELAGSTLTIRKAANAKLLLYDQAILVDWKVGLVAYEPLLNRLLVPYTSTTTELTANAKSLLFFPSGTAPTEGFAWGLPVAVEDPSLLGEASGAGALIIKTGKGHQLTWRGLKEQPFRLTSSYWMAEPGRLGLTTMQVSDRQNRQCFQLWKETASDRFSSVECRYGSPFTLRYNSLSAGIEAWQTDTELTAHLDKPLKVDGSRLKLEAMRATVVFYVIKKEAWVVVMAVSLIEQLTAKIAQLQQQKRNREADEQRRGLRAFALALQNAILTVTHPSALLLAGQWKLQEPFDTLETGGLIVCYGLTNLLPILPDPYVSNIQLPQYRRRSFAVSSAQTSSALVMTWVQWIKPENASLSFHLAANPVRSSAEVTGFTSLQNSITAGTKPADANQSLPYLKDPAEDQVMEQGLQDIFLKSLQTSFPVFSLLDVSTNASQFGVSFGLGRPRPERRTVASQSLPFQFEGMNLVTATNNVHVFTLPQIQWEPVETIQNPNVLPSPFPSPATANNQGGPTLIGTQSYQFVSIAPKPVISNLVTLYNQDLNPAAAAALFTLPFGMKAVASFRKPNPGSQVGTSLSLNEPGFQNNQLRGGIQIKVVASSDSSEPDVETPGFEGATIQTRNLVDLLSGNPLGLSVLGPVVDTIFNNEFKPAGLQPRVPVQRIDFSGFGASLFSNWLNPNAAIAATSQAQFNVLIGRTAHEVVQVRSIMYMCTGRVNVVRTITLRRTAAGGVKRYDSGWIAEGPSSYDFSYYTLDGSNDRILKLSPYEFHPGVVKQAVRITDIRETGRKYEKPGPNPGSSQDDIVLEEVFFNADFAIEDVEKGQYDGFVPSKGQRGFVQIAPSGAPISREELQEFLRKEGSLGGPVDCLVNVGNSKQTMRLVRIDINSSDKSGYPVFVAAARGSLILPKEGDWNTVRRKENGLDVVPVSEDGALPLVRRNGGMQPYLFADPETIFDPSAPIVYGLMQATKTQRTLFLEPTIQRNVSKVFTESQPYFADPYSLLNSKSVFPALDTTFRLGVGGSELTILGNGLFELTSSGSVNVPPNTIRELMNDQGSRIYIDYSDGAGATTQIHTAVNSLAPVSWEAQLKKHSVVMDLGPFPKVITITGDFQASSTSKPVFVNPDIKFGSVVSPIIEIMRFLGNFNPASGLDVAMSNSGWDFKFKGIIKPIKLKYEQEGAIGKLKVYVSNVQVAPPPGTPHVEAGLAVFKAEVGLKLGIYFKQAITRSSSAEPLSVSSGGFLAIEGSVAVLCVAITPVIGLYGLGIAEIEASLDDKKGKFKLAFKLAFGLELAISIPVVGEVAVSYAMGMELQTGSSFGIFAILIIRGEAELLGGVIVVGISIEAKGGTEIDSGETFCVCEVTFGLDISVIFVINISFEVTWEEKKRIS